MMIFRRFGRRMMRMRRKIRRNLNKIMMNKMTIYRWIQMSLSKMIKAGERASKMFNRAKYRKI